MTFLAKTLGYYVEFECGFLSIARADGMALCIKGAGLSAEFRSCLKTHGPERAIETFIKIAQRVTIWKPMYRHRAMPALLLNHDPSAAIGVWKDGKPELFA